MQQVSVYVLRSAVRQQSSIYRQLCGSALFGTYAGGESMPGSRAAELHTSLFSWWRASCSHDLMQIMMTAWYILGFYLCNSTSSAVSDALSMT